MWSDTCMKMYADQRPRRVCQITADVVFIIWIGLWLWQGVSTFHSTMDLTKPTARTEQAATSLATNMGEAADSLGAIPLIGPAAAKPFLKAEASAVQLADAGTRTEQSLQVLAWKFGLSLGLGPSVLFAAFYLPRRIRFIREATTARAFLGTSHDVDLFALRALAHQPLDVLSRISEDPVGAWRSRDADVINALARAEISSRGLTPPV